LKIGIRMNRNSKINSISTNNQNSTVLEKGSSHRKYSTLNVKNK
jgi:hypothetical protein